MIEIVCTNNKRDVSDESPDEIVPCTSHGTPLDAKLSNRGR